MRAMVLAMLAATTQAMAQSLFQGTPPPPPEPGVIPDPSQHLYGVSMIAVAPPRPASFKVHDLVTIIINENSKQKSDQSLDTSKEGNAEATLGTMIDPWKLLELELGVGATQDLKFLDAKHRREYTGDGEYERNDRFTDRVTAEIIDVKPNGVLVLEAKRVIKMDEEVKTVVVSGNCRMQDVTKELTIQSNQLANLMLVVDHEGEVSKSARKGWLTKALEAAFPF